MGMIRFLPPIILTFLLSNSNKNNDSMMAVTAYSISSTSSSSPALSFLSTRRMHKTALTTRLFASQGENDKLSMAQEEAAKLRELAAVLRGEVSEFEKSKADTLQQEQDEQKMAEKEILETRERYSAEVPILKGDGSTVLERVDFPPRTAGGKSFIQAVKAPLPLGLILGEHETIPGAIRVDDVDVEGNGCAVGVQIGDLLRACTACQVIMETPTWQLLAGGIGQPKTKRFMYGTDGRPFEEVMDALGSNRMDPDGGDVWLVIEREEGE